VVIVAAGSEPVCVCVCVCAECSHFNRLLSTLINKAVYTRRQQPHAAPSRLITQCHNSRYISSFRTFELLTRLCFDVYRKKTVQLLSGKMRMLGGREANLLKNTWSIAIDKP